MQFNIVIQHFITTKRGVSGKAVFSNQKKPPHIIPLADKMNKK